MQTITDTTLQYQFEHNGVLSAETEGVANTLYESQGDYELKMPPVSSLEVGTVIGLRQVTGNGIISQETSELGLKGDEHEYSSEVVPQGHTRIAYLANGYNRKVWYLLPEVLTPPQPDATTAPVSLLHPNTVPEHFTVDTLTERNNLPTGNEAGEVSPGDTVEVTDFDGTGNNATYMYVSGVGYVSWKKGETEYTNAQVFTNGSVSSINAGIYIGVNGGSYQTYAPGYKPVGIHVGVASPSGEDLHVVSSGIVTAVISGAVVTGDPLTPNASGQLIKRVPGASTPVVAFYLSNINGRQLVLLVPPFMPNSGTIEIGVEAPLDVGYQSNVLEANRLSGKYFYHGRKAIFITEARVKLKTLGSSSTEFDIFPGIGSWMFVGYLVAGGSPDTYGAPEYIPAATGRNRVEIGSEIRFSNESPYNGAKSPTFLLTYEEEVTL